ncbi:MAG TPA: hypothetical protein VHW67_02990 [Solirubrobacteraceae bacterium]|jgi:hypothetical protein|nr:hypothetical protein [Solirubrobacteraceae bacterium]
MTDEQPEPMTAPEANVPTPPSERGNWLLAGGLALLGAAVLLAALLLGGGSGSAPRANPPPVVAATPTPTPSATASSGVTAGVDGAAGGGRSTASPGGASGAAAASGTARSGRHGRSHRAAGAIVDRPSAKQQQLDAARFVDQTQTHISTRWMEGFYPIYAVAQRTFGVSWLLIASIHRQESAFSTASDTYAGLNFAGCCGGPMQFNVTNGPVSTWQLVSDSFRYGRRPASYDHVTPKHPSIYDDFDAIMAAAHLLSADGAGPALDGAAWNAAYDYYGHDATGVTYADQVLARAIGWSQHGFCINCGTDTSLIEAVHAAYGAPVLAALSKASAARVVR